MGKMDITNRRARVFISCGQMKGSNELEIAHKIQHRLEELGFDPWVAVDVHSLRGLRENIFEQLTNSEYFVFADFKRDKLERSKDCRGSLFSNQELALVSYLEIPAVIFQEKGSRKETGCSNACKQMRSRSPTKRAAESDRSEGAKRGMGSTA